MTWQRAAYYSAAWLIVQDDLDNFANNGSPNGTDKRAQQLWGARYIDDAVLRRVDLNLDGDYLDDDSHNESSANPACVGVPDVVAARLRTSPVP